MNVGAIVSVGMYFDTRRNLAIGLALCGSGAGMTIAPLVIEPIVTEHGLFYTYIVLAGFSLQGVIAGFLVKPLKPLKLGKEIGPREKDIIDRVLELAKKAKNIKDEDEENYHNNDAEGDNMLQASKMARMQQLAIDSNPCSQVGSQLSVGVEMPRLNGPTATITLPSSVADVSCL